MKTVYALLDPRSQQIRYVGICADIKRRMRQHLSDAKHGKQLPVYDWIRDLIAANSRPACEPIERTDDDEREAYWINFYREQGHPLTNLMSGGRNLHHEQTIIKMRRPKTPEHRAAAAAALQKVRDSGCFRLLTGDDNPMRKHPESVLRGESNAIAKLTSAQVNEMRIRFASGESTVSLGKSFCVSQHTAWRIVHRKTWRHLPDPMRPSLADTRDSRS